MLPSRGGNVKAFRRKKGGTDAAGITADAGTSLRETLPESFFVLPDAPSAPAAKHFHDIFENVLEYMTLLRYLSVFNMKTDRMDDRNCGT